MTFLTQIINRIQQRQSIKRFKKHYQIPSKSRAFHAYYQDANGFILSKSARKHNPEPSLTYGEIQFEPFAALLSLLAPTADDHFFDLGSGIGKACLTATMVFNMQQATGVECLTELYEESVRIKHKTPSDLQKRLIFKHGQLLNINIQPATIIFINATAFFGNEWENIVHFLSKNTQQGTRIIVTSKSLPTSKFLLLHKTVCLMSWGPAHIQIYSRLNVK